MFFEVRRELTKRICQHRYRYPPLGQVQEGSRTINLLNGIFAAAARAGVFVTNWDQQVQGGPVADMPRDAGRFLCPTGSMQDGDSVFQGVRTGLHGRFLENNDYSL